MFLFKDGGSGQPDGKKQWHAVLSRAYSEMGGETEQQNSILTAFSWRTIFSHLHRSKRAKISQFLLVCVPPIHSHRTNMLWVLLASIAGRSSLVKFGSNFIDYLQGCRSTCVTIMHCKNINSDNCSGWTENMLLKPGVCDLRGGQWVWCSSLET